MNVLVLTSTRADYGIYLPLLKKLKADPFFNLKIVAFGTHLSQKHGYTLNQILEDGFDVAYRIESVVDGDSPAHIASSMATTMEAFSSLWTQEKDWTEIAYCLGDRYEMFAAVSASVPFNISFAHLHGGETTLGAIDNAFRHSITSMSQMHFASTEKNMQRVKEIIGSNKHVYNVGALSLDNLRDIEILDLPSFQEKFGIELNHPVLVTFHPETVRTDQNEIFVKELIGALTELNDQIIITMPNADTNSEVIRKELMRFAAPKSNVHIVESFGTQGYFSCLHHCSFIIGNSSSGIIEAASFGKFVINLGDRQKGRQRGINVMDCEIRKNAILNCISELLKKDHSPIDNIYGNGHAADRIINALKQLK